MSTFELNIFIYFIAAVFELLSDSFSEEIEGADGTSLDAIKEAKDENGEEQKVDGEGEGEEQKEGEEGKEDAELEEEGEEGGGEGEAEHGGEGDEVSRVDAEDTVSRAAGKPKKLTNQFNFCERAALTYNNPTRVCLLLILFFYLIKLTRK